jgi:hypothetical protein
MEHNLFVSVHVPKTAGTSFRNFLESIFGEQLLLDYRSKPLDVGYEARAIGNSVQDTATYQDIHERLKRADVCVHGHFFPAKYLSVFPDAKLISWVREPAQRLINARFFGDLRATRFDSVGIVERYEASLSSLCQQYSWHAPTTQNTPKERSNPAKNGPEYELSEADIKRVKQLNALDYSLYEEVLRGGKPWKTVTV